MTREQILRRMIDDLAGTPEDDPDPAECRRWIDAQARQRGIAFREMALEVLYGCDEGRALRRWLDGAERPDRAPDGCAAG